MGCPLGCVLMVGCAVLDYDVVVFADGEDSVGYAVCAV